MATGAMEVTLPRPRGQQLVEAAGITAGSTTGTSVTGGSPGGTKGSWAQVIASTAYHTHGFYLMVLSTGGCDVTFDVGIGGAGSEVVLVPDINVMASTETQVEFIWCPMEIAAGTRVAVRCATSTASVAHVVSMNLFAAGPASFGHQFAEAMGVSGASATVVDPGATANTKGAWTQLIASTSRAARSFHLNVQGAAYPSGSDQRSLVDVAIGGAGSEVIIVPDILFAVNNTLARNPGLWLELPREIPAGSRVAVRSACSINTALDRLLYVSGILWG